MAGVEPVLNEFDRQSAVWMKLKAHLESRLATLRKQNDDKPMEDTLRHRGRIAEVKALLALGDDPKILFDESKTFKD